MNNKVKTSYWNLNLIDDLIKDGTLEEDPRPYDHHVNFYEVARSYGGPEEGGWYYDTGTLVSDELFPDLASGIARAEEIKADFEIMDKRVGRGSYLIRVERKIGKDYPEYRPHWE